MANDPATFYSRTQSARKVIVVDLGFLGDTVHLLPALWEIKKAYPQAELHVLTSAVGCEVLRMASGVDRAWAMPLDRANRTFGNQWQIIRELRRQKFDVAFNFSGADRTIFITALSGAKWRIGHPGGRRHFWNSWFIPEWTRRQDPNLVTYEQRRRMLVDCGLKIGEPKFGLQVPSKALQWAHSLVPESANTIHISPCSAKETREWPLDRHAVFLRKLWEHRPDLHVIASAGTKPRERERLTQLARLMSDKRLLALPEPPTIPQLAAVLSCCRLHLGPDSGVLHLAFALGVPTVSFFREQGAWRSFMPVGPNHFVISMPCHCVDHVNAPCEKLGRAECFQNIEPERVLVETIKALQASFAAATGSRQQGENGTRSADTCESRADMGLR